MNNSKTARSGQYPILGEPKQMFEGDNVFVVSESAEIGKKYAFVCPRCHSYFVSQINSDGVKKVKCPDCETYVCFSSVGRDPESSAKMTRVSPVNDADKGNPIASLSWKDGQHIRLMELKPGSITIGRKDDNEPSVISIDDQTASRRSLRLSITKGEQSGKYTYKVTVLRTTNAVFVNHNKLYTGDSIYLNLNDFIIIGKTRLTLVANPK